MQYGPSVHLSHARSVQDLSGGNRKVLDNVNLSFYPDAKIGVVGVNGSGKSTLLRIMAGHRQGVQRRGLGSRRRPHRLSAAGTAARPGKVGARQRHGGRGAEAGAPRPLQRTRGQLFGRNRRRDDEAPGRDRSTGPVGSRLQGRSGDGRAALSRRRRRCGEPVRRRAPPRRAVPAAAGAPDILLLDEPTNHLDAESVEWLEGHLRNYTGCHPVVTHDRYFLDNVTGWILELDRGKGIPYEGNYSSWLAQKQKRLSRKAARRKRASARSRANGMDFGFAQGAPGQIQGALRAL